MIKMIDKGDDHYVECVDMDLFVYKSPVVLLSP